MLRKFVYSFFYSSRSRGLNNGKYLLGDGYGFVGPTEKRQCFVSQQDFTVGPNLHFILFTMVVMNGSPNHQTTKNGHQYNVATVV